MSGGVGMKNGKKKLYSILASLSCLNIGTSTNAKDVSQLSSSNSELINSDNYNNNNDLNVGAPEKQVPKLYDSQPLDNLHDASINANSYITNNDLTVEKFDMKSQSDEGLTDSYQSNLKRRSNWEQRLKKTSVQSGTKNPLSGNPEEKFKNLKTAAGVAILGLSGLGAHTLITKAWPTTKSILRYRYKTDIRKSKDLLESSKEPGITNSYQCIMANALIPDSITISNDSIPCLNKEFQPDVIHLYKSTQIFKDDGDQKRTITFGENIKTPNNFVIQKKQGTLVLEFSNQHLKNGLKVYAKANDLELKLNDISNIKTDSNWGITIYEANGLTLFLDVPKNKIKKTS